MYFSLICFLTRDNTGIEASPNGQFVAIVEKKNGKDYISIYHGNSFILLHVRSVQTMSRYWG